MIKCRDVAKEVVEEAAKLFGKAWVVNQEDFTILCSYCDIIDSLAEEFRASAYDIDVDPDEMTVEISLECPIAIMRSSSHKYFKLVEKCVRCGFSYADDEHVALLFVFPSVWTV